MPEFNLNLILHPDPRQFRTPLPIQRKRGPGACPPPPRGLQKKKKSPAFPLLQAVQTAPEFAQKGRSHGAARVHSKTKLLRSKNGVPPPLFRPGHRLKYRSKAIKIWEPQKNTARFSFFFMLCTKSRFCPRQNRAVIAAKGVL